MTQIEPANVYVLFISQKDTACIPYWCPDAEFAASDLYWAAPVLSACHFVEYVTIDAFTYMR